MKIIKLILLLTLSLSLNWGIAQNCGVSNNIGGTVFGDFNSNGINDEYLTGQKGVTVIAYSSLNAVVSQSVTDKDGKYLLLVPNGQKVRVEFTNLPAGMYPSFYGTNSGTTVQFITSPTCSANLGLTNNESHVQDNPKVIAPIFVNGNPLLGGTAGQRNALVGLDYLATGTAPSINVLAQSAQIGCVWGTAWNKKDQQLFISAAVKRHSGTGPLGMGGIYRVTGYPSGAATINNYIDLSSCINLGTVTRPDLPATVLTSNRDEDAYSKTGKVGLGGLAVSTDGTTLWTINLNSKTLVKIQIRTSPSSPLKTTITCSDVTEYPIPSTCGANTRPWAVAWHDDKVYVGTVCDNATLNANAYTFNPATATFSAPILSFSVAESPTFKKGCTTFGVGCQWNAWVDNYPTALQGYALEIIYPQPIFSDIDFDAQGNMILGFLDRFSNQTGFNNYFKPNSNTLYSGNSGGDTYYAYNNGNGTFTFEKNGDLVDAGGTVIRDGCGNSATAGYDFFCGDQWQNIHNETSVGTNAVHKGRSEVLGGVFDPIDAFSGGLLRSSLLNGSKVTANQLYEGAGASFGKSAGLGDIELLAENAPIQIGNYVWNDLDKDGLQDAGEAPLASINVQLVNASGGIVASTTTNAQGQYYFSSTTTPTLLPNTAYYIVLTNYTAGGGVSNYFLTTANASGTNDNNDSDASLAGGGLPANVAGKAYISLSTGNYGENNHSYDFGLSEASCVITALIDYGTGNSCEIVSGSKYVDFAVQVSWQNVTIGSTIQVQVSGATAQTFVAATANGVKTVPINNATFTSGTITVTNLSAPTCTYSLPYSYPNYLVLSNVTVTACTFNSTTAASSSTVTATLTWQGLTVGDVLTATAGGQSQTINVTSASGSQAISIPISANGAAGTLSVTSQLKNCASTSSNYTAPPACPQCALGVSAVAVGDCSGSGPYTSPLDVTVFWANATIGNSINVTVNHVGGPTTQTISNIATATGSQTVSFTVPSDGTTNNAITLAWSNGATCSITGSNYNARPTCNQKYDVAISKTVNVSSATVGSNVIFTINAFNQGNQAVTNVIVSDPLPTGLNYVSNSATLGTYNTSTKVWTIPSLAVGQTASLTLTAQVATGALGVYFNIAEVLFMTETDIDSNPNNQVETEDDIAEACVTVPIQLCGDDTYLATAKLGYYNYQWYKDGLPISGATATSYLITTTGTYHYTANLNPGGGTLADLCCPITVLNSACTCELTNTYTVASCIEDVVAEPTTPILVTSKWFGASTTSNSLVVNVNGTQQTFAVTSTNGTNTATFSIPTNGSAVAINAALSQGGCAATVINTNAPTACVSCALSITGVSVGACTAPTNTHSLSYTINWSGLTAGEFIQVSAGGVSQSVMVLSASGSQTFNTTVAATGNSQNIVIAHTGVVNCEASVTYASPSPCPPCNFAINYIIPSACYYNSGSSNQDVEVGFEWLNATTSTVSVTINGQTVTYNTGGAASGTGSVTITGLPANGATFPVTAQLTGACSASSSYTASSQCPPCALSISNATIGGCTYDSQNGIFVNSVSVTTTWANALAGSTIKFLAIDLTANPDTTTYYFFIEPTYSITGGTATVTFNVPSTANVGSIEAVMLPDYTHCFASNITYTTMGVPNAGADVNTTLNNVNLAAGTPSGGTWSALASNPVGATINGSGQISGMTTNGIYGFVYTIGSGCGDTVYVTRCILTPAIAKSNDLSCPTPTATLTASPATGVSYLWDNGSTSATRVVSAAGTYSVTLTDIAAGCSANANVTVTSTISIPPCVPVTTQKTK
jgi:uncharacterized repeat protein (TIGR01451 family)